MDLVLRNARLAETRDGRLVDIGIENGRIVALATGLGAAGETLDLAGRLVVPGLVETHLHLDKTCILERCRAEADPALLSFETGDVLGRFAEQGDLFAELLSARQSLPRL